MLNINTTAFIRVLVLSCMFCASTLHAADDPSPENELLNTAFLKVGGGLPDDFQSLVTLRKQMLNRQSGLEAEIKSLNDEKERIANNANEIDDRINNLQVRMERDANALTNLEAREALTEQDQFDIDNLRAYRIEDEYQLKRFQADKARYQTLNSTIERINLDLEEIDKTLAPLEHKIADLLNIEDERNSFRTWISVSFCVLVAIVIIGFYVIALQKEQIAESIFSGEKGIQFVTIFLIIIAIILFGIMGILESKELSALLGGLSGYILGRVSNRASNSQTNE